MKRLTGVLPRRTCGYWWIKSWTWADSVQSHLRKPAVSWAVSKEAWPAGRGKWFCSSTPIWWDLTWSHVSSSGALSTRRTWSCWSGSRGGPQRWSEGWSTFPVRKSWELELFSLEKRRLQRDLIVAFQYSARAYKKGGDKVFSKTCCNRIIVSQNAWVVRDL